MNALATFFDLLTLGLVVQSHHASALPYLRRAPAPLVKPACIAVAFTLVWALHSATDNPRWVSVANELLCTDGARNCGFNNALQSINDPLDVRIVDK